jgi:hypothetical protein
MWLFRARPDDIVVVEVMATELDRTRWSALKKQLEKDLRQEMISSARRLWNRFRSAWSVVKDSPARPSARAATVADQHVGEAKIAV